MAFIAPEVNPQPIPGVRIQPAANETTFGGGPGLSATGQEVQKIAASSGEIAGFQKIQEAWEVQRANEAGVQEGAAKLSAIHSNLLTDPNEGLPAYRGTNAMAGQDTLWAKYQKSANEISESLPNPEQKAMFNKIALQSGNSFLQQVKAHVHQELERHDSNTFDALVMNKADESGKTYGNAQALEFNHKLVNDAAEARARRLGLDEQETKKFMRAVNTTYHETVLSQMVNDPNFQKQTRQYFNQYQGEMDTESRDRVRNLIDIVPKQQEAAGKAAQEQFYKANMRTAMLDLFDGKLTLSEAQRRYRENQINESDYNQLSGKLSKTDAMVHDPLTYSDPEAFNMIRQAQLTGSKDPGEIQRMIMKGAAAKDISMEDGKYLLGVNSEAPPTPRDKQIEASANNLRDFGSRYFAETNFFGHPTNQENTSKEAESLVQDFYSQVDKAKAKGEDIDKLRDQIKKTYMQKRFPGLGNYDKAPDIVVNIKGQVTRVLNPDQRSALKPRYKITPASSTSEDDQ